jgi:O-antigen/teichoic acid export membrane protein
MNLPGLRRIAHGSLALVTGNVTGAALNFATSIIIGRGLGEIGFGHWVFAMAWASLLVIASEFGLNTFLTREVARAHARANQLLLGSFIAKLVLFTVWGMSFWAVSPFLGSDPDTIAALRVTIFFALGVVIYGSFTAVFRARAWMTLILWLNVGGQIAQCLLFFYVIRSGGGVLQLMVSAFAVQTAQVLGAGLGWWFKLRASGGPFVTSPQLVQGMLRQSIPFALAGILGVIQMRSSVLMLNYLRSPAEVGWFGAASRFGEAAKLIPNGLFDAVFPVFSSRSEEGTAYGGRLSRLFQWVLLIIVVPTVVGVVIFARPLLVLTYGASFSPAAPVLTWLGIGLFPSLMNAGVEVYLYARGGEHEALRLSAIAVAIQVTLSLPLILWQGALGAAIASLLGEIVIWWPLRQRMKNLQPVVEMKGLPGD